MNTLKPCPICNTNKIIFERTLSNFELIKCNACDFVYVNLTDQAIKDANSTFDDDNIATYEEQQTFIDYKWFEKIVKKLTHNNQSGKVLDIGCGNGVLLKHFIKQGWTGYGVDISPWAKDFALKYNYTLYPSEVEKLDIPDNSFDIITSTSTLEHVAQPLKHIEKIMKILKPGGIAYFCGIPNYGSLSIRLNISNFYYNEPPQHVNFFTYRSMQILFSGQNIKDKTNNLSIKSYGIPEIHKIYNLFQKVKTNDSNNLKTPTNQKHNSVLYNILSSTSIEIYYHLGRLFNLGDKLETIVIKR